MGIKEVLSIDNEESNSGMNKMIFPLVELKNAVNDGINISHLLTNAYCQTIEGTDSKDIYCFFRNNETEKIGGAFKLDNYYLRLGIILDELVEFLSEGEEVNQLVLFTKI